MPEYLDDFNTDEFSLIVGDAVEHIFDEEKDDVRLIVFNKDGNIVIDSTGNLASYYIYDSGLYEADVYDPTDDTDEDTPPVGFTLSDGTDIYLYPNKILSEKYFASGVYELNFHFLRNFFTIANEEHSANIDTLANPRFVINEISPSRKEVRLLAINDEVPANFSIIDGLYDGGSFASIFNGTDDQIMVIMYLILY